MGANGQWIFISIERLKHSMTEFQWPIRDPSVRDSWMPDSSMLELNKPNKVDQCGGQLDGGQSHFNLFAL